MAANPWDFSQILLQGGNAGQLIGRGIENAASGLAGGIERYAQIKDRNKQLQGAVDSTTKFLEEASKMKGLPEGLKSLATELNSQIHDPNLPLAQKAAMAQQAGQNIGQYILLGQAAVQSQEQAQRAKTMQNIAMMQQFGGAGAAAQPYQNTVDRLNALGEMPAGTSVMQRMGALSPGAGPGVLSPQAGAQIQANRQNPAMQIQQQMLGATGQLASPEAIMDYMAKQAALTGKADKATPQEVTLPGGARVAFSPSTGAFSVLPQTPQQIAATKGAEEEAQLGAKDAQALLTDISERGEAARSRLSAINRVFELYKEGATSGFGQPVLTKARAAFARIGLGGEGLATQQQFEKEVNSVNLLLGKELLKGGGSVSNFERELVQNAQANPSLTPEANIAIFEALKHIDERNMRLAKLRNDLEAEGLSNVEIAKRIRRERDNSPIPNVEKLQELGGIRGAAPTPGSQITTPSGIKIKSIKKVN